MNETYSITLTRQELNVIRAALGRMPHDDARPVVDGIASQINSIEAERAQAARTQEG